MLRLSELSGFLVGGIVREKIVLKNIGEKSRQKTATENPFPIKLWGGVFLVSGWMCGGYTQNNRPRKVEVLCEA